MSDDPGWPWQIWLRMAVMTYSLSPQDFWDMPLLEWRYLIQKTQNDPLAQMGLTPLMARFPDTIKQDKNNDIR